MFGFDRVTIYEYERGVRFVKGRLKTELGPGSYRIGATTQLIRMDMRSRFLTVAGQEVLTRDAVPLKVSAAMTYRIIDASMACTVVESLPTALYADVQAAIRVVASEATLDAFLDERDKHAPRLLELAAPPALVYGVEVMSVAIKDLMFAGEIKRALANVAIARKGGLAALERARAETATLRSLSNAAHIMNDNPGIFALRMLQAIGESSGNTIVFGTGTDALPVPYKTAPAPPAADAG